MPLVQFSQNDSIDYPPQSAMQCFFVTSKLESVRYISVLLGTLLGIVMQLRS